MYLKISANQIKSLIKNKDIILHNTIKQILDGESELKVEDKVYEDSEIEEFSKVFDYSQLEQEEEIENLKNRLRFFKTREYCWDKNTLEIINQINIEDIDGNFIMTNGFESLMYALNKNKEVYIHANENILEKLSEIVGMAVVNNVIETDSFISNNFTIKQEDVLLIEIQKDLNYYLKAFNNIHNVNSLNANLYQTIEEINNLSDENFTQFIRLSKLPDQQTIIGITDETNLTEYIKSQLRSDSKINFIQEIIRPGSRVEKTDMEKTDYFISSTGLYSYIDKEKKLQTLLNFKAKLFSILIDHIDSEDEMLLLCESFFFVNAFVPKLSFEVGEKNDVKPFIERVYKADKEVDKERYKFCKDFIVEYNENTVTLVSYKQEEYKWITDKLLNKIKEMKFKLKVNFQINDFSFEQHVDEAAVKRNNRRLFINEILDQYIPGHASKRSNWKKDLCGLKYFNVINTNEQSLAYLNLLPLYALNIFQRISNLTNEEKYIYIGSFKSDYHDNSTKILLNDASLLNINKIGGHSFGFDYKAAVPNEIMIEKINEMYEFYINKQKFVQSFENLVGKASNMDEIHLVTATNCINNSTIQFGLMAANDRKKLSKLKINTIDGFLTNPVFDGVNQNNRKQLVERAIQRHILDNNKEAVDKLLADNIKMELRLDRMTSHDFKNELLTYIINSSNVKLSNKIEDVIDILMQEEKLNFNAQDYNQWFKEKNKILQELKVNEETNVYKIKINQLLMDAIQDIYGKALTTENGEIYNNLFKEFCEFNNFNVFKNNFVNKIFEKLNNDMKEFIIESGLKRINKDWFLTEHLELLKGIDINLLEKNVVSILANIEINKDKKIDLLIRNLNLLTDIDVDKKKDLAFLAFREINKTKELDDSFEVLKEYLDKNSKRDILILLNLYTNLIKTIPVNEDKDNYSYIKESEIISKISSTTKMLSFFNKTFIKDKEIIQKIGVLSKEFENIIANQMIEISSQINRNMENMYVLLPEQLKVLAFDKLKEGKGLYKVLSEISLVEKINDSPVKASVKKRKI